jgi:RimJ/RimL family protein N-acetyltransferase
VAAIAGWRYPGRYATYDVDDPATLGSDHWAVSEDGRLVGYCCFGGPARVKGSRKDPDVLDVGYGMAPDLMGRGLGYRFVETIIAFALERYERDRLRLYVLDWNERSLRVAARHGFEQVSELTNDEGRFLVLERP